jgi:hypothetical protein
MLLVFALCRLTEHQGRCHVKMRTIKQAVARNVACTFSASDKLAAKESERSDGELDSDDHHDDFNDDDDLEQIHESKRHSHTPVRVDDPDFADKLNLILNTVIVNDVDSDVLHSCDPTSVPRNVLHSLSKALDPAANHDKDNENFVFKAVRGEDAVNEY